jgi:voltage-gated potassium channel Kch
LALLILIGIKIWYLLSQMTDREEPPGKRRARSYTSLSNPIFDLKYRKVGIQLSKGALTAMKDHKISLSSRVKYEFDKMISKGPFTLGIWLAFATLFMVLFVSLVVHISRIDPALGLPAIFWTMLLQALAPNPVDVNAGPWRFLLAMLVITLGGIFMVSIFIGIVTSGLENKVQSLRRGRSKVIEKNHTVILGWDEHIFTIISELAIAYETHARSCIVILGDKDKVEMEDEIRAKVHHNKKTEIVCRSGNPIDMADLEIVSLNSARSIIILAPEGEDADNCVIKTLLAITNNPHRRAQPFHIVTEIQDVTNMEAARLVGKEEATIFLISDIIAHIIAQTCRQSGLSVVYTELLNFEGDEIYFNEQPELVGHTFGEALLMYEDSAVIGLLPHGGEPRLNPPMDIIVQSGDMLIVVSENETTVHLSHLHNPPVQANLIRLQTPRKPEPEFTLILGWNKRGATIISELDQYVPPGSMTTVVDELAEVGIEIDQIKEALKNQAITFRTGNITDRKTLNSLSIENYNHVIVLADLEEFEAQVVDARTLITLLHLRDIDDQAGHPFSIVSEMLDVRNRNLAEITHVDDFIVSDELASLLMAQISENKDLRLVFDDLFYSEGSEIYLKPAADYVMTGKPVNFFTVVEAARRKGEVALGYILYETASDPARSFGVVLNPEKSRELIFTPNDRLVLLAEH